jgi:hypothetical protein
LSQGGARLPGISAACFTPLWAAVHTSPAQAAAAVDALAGSGLIQVGGLATTLRASGQQWDWPNGWPPLQQMIVQGLARSRDARGEAMGRELAGAWLVNNYAGWRRSGFMHEKYDVTQIGHRGGGGEYEPQVSAGRGGDRACARVRSLSRWRAMPAFVPHAPTPPVPIPSPLPLPRHRSASAGPTAWCSGCCVNTGGRQSKSARRRSVQRGSVQRVGRCDWRVEAGRIKRAGSRVAIA